MCILVAFGIVFLWLSSADISSMTFFHGSFLQILCMLLLAHCIGDYMMIILHYVCQVAAEFFEFF